MRAACAGESRRAIQALNFIQALLFMEILVHERSNPQGHCLPQAAVETTSGWSCSTATAMVSEEVCQWKLYSLKSI